jgi:hypothetical protein
MRRVATAVVLFLATITTAGCASRIPAGVADSAGSGPTAAPSAFSTAFAMRPGDSNPEATIPNPATGEGDLALVKALLPQTAAGRAAAFLLPPAVVALPDKDSRSLFIGLRQFSSPVAGPRDCLGWTIGLWHVAVTSFNVPGVQLAITEQSVPAANGFPEFSEAIITGPPRVLAALADPPLPAACRAITSETSYPGGVRPLNLARHGLRSRAYEVTGTGKVLVWQWVEVVSGPGFVLEIRIPNQSQNAALEVQLPPIAVDAYRRATAFLAASHG